MYDNTYDKYFKNLENDLKGKNMNNKMANKVFINGDVASEILFNTSQIIPRPYLKCRHIEYNN